MFVNVGYLTPLWVSSLHRDIHKMINDCVSQLAAAAKTRKAGGSIPD
jgi:hypothetical protein